VKAGIPSLQEDSELSIRILDKNVKHVRGCQVPERVQITEQNRGANVCPLCFLGVLDHVSIYECSSSSLGHKSPVLSMDRHSGSSGITAKRMSRSSGSALCVTPQPAKSLTTANINVSLLNTIDNA